MKSINSEVQKLFDGYCMAKGITGLQMTPGFERIIWESVQMGLTVEDLTAVIRERRKGIQDGSRKHASILMRNLFGNDSSDVLDEAADIRSRNRVKVLDPAKRSILEQTGRPATPPGNPVVTSAEVVQKLREDFRKAADA